MVAEWPGRFASNFPAVDHVTSRGNARLRIADDDCDHELLLSVLGKVVAMLPPVRERYEALVKDLSNVPARYIAPMRERLRHLVGEITLRPTLGGYLEAEMVGRNEGLLHLAVGQGLNSVGCGGRI